ncbi:hypothetical protein AM587_10002884 [Phytophthora nicotianae]|uniref:RxLR effector protein n=1 Tax=Phytophthora nicotianae TaxID=4792 RepID=A0A0W8D4M0_PHYNI|nr:hypothetical protein AM587_10002884 [Phytophthora nicotianae]KUF91354.1 Alpha-actinin A [Phytophthora nicotianae]
MRLSLVLFLASAAILLDGGSALFPSADVNEATTPSAPGRVLPYSRRTLRTHEVDDADNTDEDRGFSIRGLFSGGKLDGVDRKKIKAKVLNNVQLYDTILTDAVKRSETLAVWKQMGYSEKRIKKAMKELKKEPEDIETILAHYKNFELRLE